MDVAARKTALRDQLLTGRRRRSLLEQQAAAAAVAEATGQAEANRLLAQSLTPEIIESRRVEALREAGAVYVVPEGSTPLVSVQE